MTCTPPPVGDRAAFPSPFSPLTRCRSGSVRRGCGRIIHRCPLSPPPGSWSAAAVSQNWFRTGPPHLGPGHCVMNQPDEDAMVRAQTGGSLHASPSASLRSFTGGGDQRADSAFHAGQLVVVLLSPDARFANRFRDKHARPPFYDRRGKFAGKMADDILYRFTGVSPCSSVPPIPLVVHAGSSSASASSRLAWLRAQGVLIEMFITLWQFRGFRVCLTFEFRSCNLRLFSTKTRNVL